MLLAEGAWPETFTKEVQRLRSAHAEAHCEAARDQQQDELEALKAIYDEAVSIVSAEAEPPVVLRLELPIEVEGNRVQVSVETEDGVVDVGEIEAVPPLVFLCALPGGYPIEGNELPAFVLEAPHLSADKLDELAQSLRDTGGDMASGEPIIFTWASMLQEELRLEGALVLRDGTYEDGRMVFAMDVAEDLLAFNCEAAKKRRSHALHGCPVCLDDVLGERGVFLSCGHFGCRSCLVQMAELHIKEGEVAALRCPVPDCREPYTQETVAELVGADSAAMERWNKLALQLCLDRMKDVAFCPRCDMDSDGNRIPCLVDEDGMAQCDSCLYVFCRYCKAAFHPGFQCDEARERMQSLEEAAAAHGRDGKAKREELRALKQLAVLSKPCPRCDTPIEKSGGCNKMTCKICKTIFCWLCGKEIEGYDHFRENNNCGLFDLKDIQAWNRQMQMRNIDRRQAQAEQRALIPDPSKIGRRCPQCRSVCARAGRSNNIHCHVCATQFCAQCFEVLPRKGGFAEHFKPRGLCPQHSDE